jgi:hypothetical protein
MLTWCCDVIPNLFTSTAGRATIPHRGDPVPQDQRDASLTRLWRQYVDSSNGFYQIGSDEKQEADVSPEFAIKWESCVE